MSLRRVTVRTAGDAAEPLRARLLELVPDGFEERDNGGVVELAAYVPEREVEAILAAFPGATAEAVEDGWEDAWRTFHRPVVVQGLWLGPPWERPPDPSRTVVIDPGRAFGTGAHPTTRLCVDLLARTTRRGSTRLGVLLDVLDGVADGHDLLGFFVGDLDVEVLLQGHDELDRIEGVGAQVLDELRVGVDVFLVDPELLDDDLLHLLLD